MSTSNNIKLADLLPPQNIFILKASPTKTNVIECLIQKVCSAAGSLDVQEILPQILQREESLSTTLDTGLSMPHARLEEIENFSAALAVLPQGAQDPSKPDTPIRVMFLFLSPARPAFFQRHLQLLAAAAEKFQQDFIKELSTCTSASEVAAKIAAK